MRGGRKFVIVSRNGVRTGYQAWKMRHWKSYGATITIATDDATQVGGAKKILEKALSLGPVAAIFNLAVVSVKRIYLIPLYSYTVINILLAYAYT